MACSFLKQFLIHVLDLKFVCTWFTWFLVLLILFLPSSVLTIRVNIELVYQIYFVLEFIYLAFKETLLNHMYFLNDFHEFMKKILVEVLIRKII